MDKNRKALMRESQLILQPLMKQKFTIWFLLSQFLMNQTKRSLLMWKMLLQKYSSTKKKMEKPHKVFNFVMLSFQKSKLVITMELFLEYFRNLLTGSSKRSAITPKIQTTLVRFWNMSKKFWKMIWQMWNLLKRHKPSRDQVDVAAIFSEAKI